jgi:hypothetical protein
MPLAASTATTHLRGVAQDTASTGPVSPGVLVGCTVLV